VTDSNTVDIGISSLKTESSATGHWQQDCTQRPDQSWNLPRSWGIVAIVSALLSAPATAVDDIWYQQRKERDAVTTVQLFKEVVGRSISRVEALSIVKRILETAESERLTLAELEASRGIQWGNEE